MKRRRTHLLPDEASIWISISDLMAGLLIIFILTLTYYMLNYTEKTDQITKNQEIKEEIFHQIKEKMENKGFIVVIDEEHWVLRMEDKVLFSSCSVDLKDQGKSIIQYLGKVMFFVFQKDRYKNTVETVFVEGHTDNIPPGNNCRIKFPTNWELSTQRAINTWKAMVDGEPGLNTLTNANKEKIFSVSGYGETRPIETNEIKLGRGKNRRIDIRIAMTPPKQDKKPDALDELQALVLGR